MKPSYGPDDVSLMATACDEAWKILETALVFPSDDYQKDTRRRMATRVMAAVEEGERDPSELKAIALG